MNGGELMTLLIVAIVMVAGIVKARYRHDRKHGLGADDSATQVENARLRDELRGMKERLAVLERLATDNNDSGARLDREIEKLRDRS